MVDEKGLVSFPDGDEGAAGMDAAPPLTLNVTYGDGMQQACAAMFAAGEIDPAMLVQVSPSATVFQGTDLTFFLSGMADWMAWYVDNVNAKAGLPTEPGGPKYWLYSSKVISATLEDLPDKPELPGKRTLQDEPKLSIFRRMDVDGTGATISEALIPAYNADRVANHGGAGQIGYLEESHIHWDVDATEIGRTRKPVVAEVTIEMWIEPPQPDPPADPLPSLHIRVTRDTTGVPVTVDGPTTKKVIALAAE